MSRKRALVLMKPFNLYPTKSVSGLRNPKVLDYLDNRRKVHEEAIKFCQNILQRKQLSWTPLLRSKLARQITDVDMVITIGGDGTLLQASHFMDDLIPVLGVNSDPTDVKEVEEFSNEFDATRSTGYLCGATVQNFEKMLDEVLEETKVPTELSRIALCVNGQRLLKYSLNDILIAHPCPATVSRFSFRIKANSQLCSQLVHCRSSGLRISTAAGSTAAMLSAGGFLMPISCQDLQYMVREPILPEESCSSLMHGFIKSDQSMHIEWHSQESKIYIDGSHVYHLIQHDDSIEVSSNAPVLKIFLSSHVIT